MAIRGSIPSTHALLEHAEFLRALAGSLLGDAAAADDVVQDTLLTALERPPARRDNLRGWLGKVARNLALLQHRERGRRARREKAAARPEARPATADVAARLEVQSRIADEVRALDEPYRTAIVLRFFDGLRPREMAARLDLPVSTVHTRIQRALERLRVRLDAAHGGDRRAWSLALAPLLVPTTKAAAAAVGVSVLSTRAIISVVVLLAFAATGVGWHLATRDTAPRADRAVRKDARGAGGAHAPEDAPVGGAPEPARPASPAARRGAKRTFPVVVTHRGRPVEGARVFSFDNAGSSSVMGPTDAAGRYTVDWRPGLTVRAAHPAYGPGQAAVGEPDQEVVVELPPERTVEFVVLDRATARPVAGARVFVVHVDGEPIAGPNAPFEGIMGSATEETFAVLGTADINDMMAVADGGAPAVDLPAVTTDGAGRARVGGLPPGRLDAVVMHGDFVPERVRRLPIDGSEHTVRLGVGGGLTVVAPTLGGESTEGFVCEVLRQDVMPIPVAGGHFGADGRLVFPHVRPGRYRVAVSSEGSSGMVVAEAEPPPPEEEKVETPAAPEEKSGPQASRMVTITDGEMTVVDFTVETTATVKGRLLLRGKSIEGRGMAWLHEANGEPRKAGQTPLGDDAGFRFDGLLPGAYELTFGTDFNTVVRHRFEVAAGQREIELDIEIPRGAVKGVVVDAAGALLPDAEVVFEPQPVPAGLINATGERAIIGGLAGRATTAADGTFEVIGLPGGAYRVLVGVEKQRAFTISSLDLPEGGAKEVRLRHDATGLAALTVRAVGADREALPFGLVLRFGDGGLGTLYALDIDPTPKPEHTFRVPPGRYAITAAAEDHAVVTAREIDVRADMEHVVRFEKGTPVTLEIRRDGAPLADATVRLVDGAGVHVGPASSVMGLFLMPRAWRTDPQGRVTASRVPPGTYEVHVNGQEAGALRVGSDPVARTFDLD